MEGKFQAQRICIDFIQERGQKGVPPPKPCILFCLAGSLHHVSAINQRWLGSLGGAAYSGLWCHWRVATAPLHLGVLIHFDRRVWKMRAYACFRFEDAKAVRSVVLTAGTRSFEKHMLKQVVRVVANDFNCITFEFRVWVFRPFLKEIFAFRKKSSVKWGDVVHAFESGHRRDGLGHGGRSAERRRSWEPHQSLGGSRGGEWNGGDGKKRQKRKGKRKKQGKPMAYGCFIWSLYKLRFVSAGRSYVNNMSLPVKTKHELLGVVEVLDVETFLSWLRILCR